MTTTPENLKVTLSAPELAVEPGQAAELVISVKNLSEVVDQYQLEVQDLDPSWVEILVGSVSLFPSDEDQLRLAVRPPRESSARAGDHPFKVIIRSREYPTDTYQATLNLRVAPFHGFEARLTPERLVTRGRGQVEVELTNSGNSPLTFDLSATDNEQGCLLEFKPTTVDVPAGGSAKAVLEAEPKSKPRFGSAKTYSVMVQATPRGLDPRVLACQVVYQPPIPKWVPAVAVAAVIAAIALIFLMLRSPATISSFEAKPAEAVNAGTPVTLSWKVSGASDIRITPEIPGLKEIKSQGEVQVTPSQTTVYKLAAKKGWSSPAEREVEVKVKAALQQFEAVAGSLSGQSIEVPQGQRFVLRWNAPGVEKVNINPLGTRPAKGEEVLTAVQTTDYVLSAEGEQLQGHVVVTVSSVPNIQQFMASPPSITRGQAATLTWNVTGVDSVNISGVGVVPASGSRAVKPKSATQYTLTANNSAGSRQLSTFVDVAEKEGTVAAAVAKKPTDIPFIRKFEAIPAKVGMFEDTTLTWEVIGAETVTIKPDVGLVDSEKGRKKMSFKIPGTKQYELTAINSLGKSTAKVKINVGL